MEINNVLIRKATADDIDILVKARIDFHLDEGKQWDKDEIEDISVRLREYFENHIQSKSLVAYIAELSGEVVSSALLSIVERPPRKPNASNLVGTVYNVFTYPQHRGNGYATLVMEAILEEAKKSGVEQVDLFATEAGMPLYEKLGFERGKFAPMRIEFKPNDV